MRSLIALLFALGAGAVFIIGQPLDLWDAVASAILLGIAGLIVDANRVWALLEKVVDRLTKKAGA